MEDLVSFLLESGLAADRRGANALLSALSEAGFLIPLGAFVEAMGSKAEPETSPGGCPPLVIVSYERPRELERCVASHADDCLLRSGEAPPISRIVIFNDHPDPPPPALLKAMGERARMAHLPLSLSGLAEKAAFSRHLAGHLADKGIDREILDFGLGGERAWHYAVGGNRNAALLFLAGDRILFEDDDQTAEYLLHPEAESGLAIGAEPEVLDYFAGDEWIAAAPPPPIGAPSLLLLHARSLGQSLAGLLADRGEEALDLSRLDPRFAASLLRRGARVRATVAGYAGDSGMGMPWGLILRQGEVRSRLVESRKTWEAALTDRRVLWVAPRDTLADSPFFRSGSIGLDARDLLPPFFPVGHNHDGVFGLLLHRYWPPGSVLHLGAAVRHEPPERRYFDREEAGRFQVRISDLAAWAIEDGPRRDALGEPGMALAEAGLHLERIGSLAPADFRERAMSLWLPRAGEFIDRIEGLLDFYDAEPSWWARDAQALIASVRAVGEGGRPWIPTDIQPRLAPDEDRAQDSCQSVLRRFGILLQAWGTIWKTAVELGEERRRFEIGL